MGKSVSVIGSGFRAARCALTLAEMGIQVELITPFHSLDRDRIEDTQALSHEYMHIWPLLLRAASHPRIKLYTNSIVKDVTGQPGEMTVRVQKNPRYVKEDICTGCGKCEEECSVKVQTRIGTHKITHGAVHSPVLTAKSVPSAYFIDKQGISPCRASCPLGINVQGFVALLGKNKIDKALAVINETAPMAGVLGRLCTHPCETKCSRERVDSPVFIQALHRYAADHAPGGIMYRRKAPAGSRKEKIAIIGSGPAGLTAAWELARRGYTPTIFESHAVVGGMLATGIPRFRLPREIREKEVEAIKALGVDIKTGVTVGRDVTYNDLLDLGYKAFFLAIGAHQNNKLGIPGEDLDGVVDCISLLFSLNLKVGTAVGSKVIVVGGGNSAVDSARSVNRVSKGDVRILCVTDKMTAVKEEVDEAIKEGIPIDYNVSVVEILGEGGKVTGVRCQKVKSVTFDSDGKAHIEHVPDSDIVLPADHVVIAIGQKPNSSVLNIKNLNTGRNATIATDPLTLETNIPGIFAGGDAVTGSNNVVSAMAAGLRAAESIDRYLKAHNLKRGRTLEPPIPVEVDLEERKPSSYKRAKMPALPLIRRKDSYEETTLGLPEDLAGRETERCLNCAVCCECLECEQACEVKAINHQDTAETIDIDSAAIIHFISKESGCMAYNKPGVYEFEIKEPENISVELSRASSIALTTAIEHKLKNDIGFPATGPTNARYMCQPCGLDKRTAVFLCRCGDSISSVIDFTKVSAKISTMPGVYSVQILNQSCTEEAAKEIKDFVEKEKISHVVLAACRCCNLEQVCFSCTDRRILCQQNLQLELPQNVNIEFSNIRELCAWIHKDDPAGATEKAIGMISTCVIRAQKLIPVVYEPRRIEEDNILIISTGLSGMAAARDLIVQGYSVDFISDMEAWKIKNQSAEDQERIHRILRDLTDYGARMSPWPGSIVLNGGPGQYEALLKYGLQEKKIKTGLVILDLFNASQESLASLENSNLISRVMSRQHHFTRVSSLDSTILHSYTVRETAGMFIIVPLGIPSAEEQIIIGQAAASRATIYLNRETLNPRSSSVVIKPQLCRGCGDCVRLCPYIELKTECNQDGNSQAPLAGQTNRNVAWVDPALCLGCGACISVCPTGAITQPLQSEVGLSAALESLLAKEEKVADR